MANGLDPDLSQVGTTALIAASARAAESRRTDRLFDDNVASAFLTGAGWCSSQSHPSAEALGDMFAIRTKFFDDRLTDFARRGGRQLVILGAGLDSRSLRLEWPQGTTVFEVDRPGVLGFKESVLDRNAYRPASRRVPVATDLAGDWRTDLLAAGIATDQPVAWLAEGLLLYLTEDQGGKLVETVTTLGSNGSLLLIEHLNRVAQNTPPGNDVTRLVSSHGEPWVSHLDDPARWLDSAGWQADVHDIRELAKAYARPVPPIADDRDSSDRRIWCVAATRKPHR
ncbi:SAM-dependent methyltransferase [Amycolatopsis alba]|uniref:SAM-dependent methyltransferase n=1 Tax=Amycolatopsis alba TaxID=76020 RepID=UPI001FD76817|nr:SAM-dependent methyltransferase [Amycolatopsis alba]